MNSVIRLLWYDGEGSERMSDARVVEVSVSGLKLRLEHALPVRSFIVCNDQKVGVSGGGTVRYCIMHRGKHQLP
jgi:hypothetical protein